MYPSGLRCKTVLALFLCVFFQNFSANGGKGNSYYLIRKVVLDAGHGGKDTGCIGRHSHEKHNALAVVLELGRLIEENYPEVQVIYTRKTDVFIPLHERANIANRAEADLFISVHCNALSVTSVAGTETYVQGQHVADENLEVVKRENSAIYLEKDYEKNYGDYDPNSPEAHIMGNMLQNAFLEQSVLFAGLVQKHVANHTGLRSRGVKQAGFLVLRATAMPAVLVETGYLTNAGDEAFLRSPEGQQRMAMGIFEAFKTYKATYEGTVPAGYAGTPEPARPVRPLPSSGPKAVKASQPTDSETNKTASRPFTIVLLESSVAITARDSVFRNIPDLHESLAEGKYLYMTGRFSAQDEADRKLTEYRSRGFQEARVIKTYQ